MEETSHRSEGVAQVGQGAATWNQLEKAMGLGRPGSYNLITMGVGGGRFCFLHNIIFSHLPSLCALHCAYCCGLREDYKTQTQSLSLRDIGQECSALFSSCPEREPCPNIEAAPTALCREFLSSVPLHARLCSS